MEAAPHRPGGQVVDRQGTRPPCSIGWPGKAEDSDSQHEVDPVLRRPVALLIGHEERAVGLDAHADVNRAVGMSSLPMGVAVEIEAVFELA